MESAFGIEHGDISKGLPRAVKNGGGGGLGSMMRLKNSAGKSAGKLKAHPGFSDSHRGNLKYLSDSEIKRGKDAKGVVDQIKFEEHMKNGYQSRGIRASLLNEDSVARRRGYKTGRTSGLARGYRGRVNEMKPLP